MDWRGLAGRGALAIFDFMRNEDHEQIAS